MSDRLKLAVENGHVVLPEGNILVHEPRHVSDLSIFNRDRTDVRTRSAAVNEELKRAGWSSLTKMEFEAAVVFLPRSKDAQRATIRSTREETSGPIIIDGAKTDGVESIYRELKERAEVSTPWSKAHGKVFALTGGDFTDWPTFEHYQCPDGWWRAPGVFSADAIDPASQLLADTLPEELAGSVVDLGCGWGFLSRAIGQRKGVTRVIMVDDDSLSVHAAVCNVLEPLDIEDFPEMDGHWQNALTWEPSETFDHVVTNPPFHTGRAADPALGQGFIRTAGRILQRQGTLWLVANSHLPYETVLEETFRDVHLLKETAQFKLYRADRPRARRKG